MLPLIYDRRTEGEIKGSERLLMPLWETAFAGVLKLPEMGTRDTIFKRRMACYFARTAPKTPPKSAPAEEVRALFAPKYTRPNRPVHFKMTACNNSRSMI